MTAQDEAVPVSTQAALCRALEVGNDVHRCFAARALGRIGGAGAVDNLIEHLADGDEDVRMEAAAALGRIGERRAGPALLDSLVRDPCGDVKLAAVEALGRLQEADAVPVLRKLIRDRDDTLAWDDTEFLSYDWDDWLDIQLKAVEAVAAIGAENAVPDIVAAIGDEMGQDLGETGVRALAGLGDAGASALAGLLGDRDLRLRRRAARALSSVDSGHARAILAGHLANADEDIRRAALVGLARHDPADPRLAPLLSDAAPVVRAEAVRLCGRHAPAALDALLDDDADEVQIAVFDLLARHPEVPRPAGLAERLRARLRGPSAEVAEAVAGRLAEVAPDDAVSDLADQLLDAGRPRSVRHAAARALAAIGGDDAADALIRGLADGDRSLRVQIMMGLGRLAAAAPPSPSSLATLMAALSRDAGVVGAAPEIERAEPPPPAPAAHGGSEDAPPTAGPVSTLDAITRGGGAPIRAAANDERPIALTDEDLAFLALARRAPGRTRRPPDPAVPADQDLPRLAARVLGEVATEAVALALAAALEDRDAEVRNEAAGSLERIGAVIGELPDAAAAALARAVAAGDRAGRPHVARALGRSRWLAAVPVLDALLDEPDAPLRREAVTALDRLGVLGERVNDFLGDDAPTVRLAAAAALARRGGPEAVAGLVAFGFAGDAVHRHDAARLLAGVDRAAANAALARILTGAPDPRRWHIAIDMIGALNAAPALPRPDQDGPNASR